MSGILWVAFGKVNRGTNEWYCRCNGCINRMMPICNRQLTDMLICPAQQCSAIQLLWFCQTVSLRTLPEPQNLAQLSLLIHATTTISIKQCVIDCSSFVWCGRHVWSPVTNIWICLVRTAWRLFCTTIYVFYCSFHY